MNLAYSMELKTDWFLPVSKKLLRVLKPTGTFILNIKEKVVEKQFVPLEYYLNVIENIWNS
jgi:DNA modification methylase